MRYEKIAINDIGKVTLGYLEWTGQDIVEYILLLCVQGATFDDLMQLMISPSPELLKKYLFYLIDYDLILYNGLKQVYMIKDRGLEVLSRIIVKILQIFVAQTYIRSFRKTRVELDPYDADCGGIYYKR
jgi:hypothetical protein